MVRRVTVVILCLVLLASLSLYSKGLVTRAFNACVNYQSPFLEQLPPAAATPGVTKQVVLIVVDGLRADTAATMPTVQSLTQRGITATTVTGQPSLSVPGSANIMSGTLQEIHGVTTNWYKGGLNVDNIFAAVQRAGLTAFGADGNSYPRFGQPAVAPLAQWQSFSDLTPEEYDAAVFNATLPAVKSGTDFVFAHFSATDEAAHSYGTRGAQYRDAAASIDGYVGQIAEAALASGGTVIITADHGHIKTGGHGGGEDEVTNVLTAMAGTGIAASQIRLQMSQADVAPTVAALIGAPVPTSATGQILYGALTAPDAGWSARAVAEAERQTNFTASYLKAIGAAPLATSTLDDLQGLKAGLASGQNAFQAARDYSATLNNTRATARAAALASTRTARLPLTILLALAPLALFFFVRKARLFKVAILVSLVYTAVYNLFYFGIHQYRWSFSAFNSEDLMNQFFNARMIETAIAVIAAAIVLGIVVRSRREPLTAMDMVEGSVVMSLSVGYLLVLQTLVFFGLWGVSFPFYIPNMTLGFKFYMDMLQLVASGLAAVVAPAAVVIIGRVRATRRAASMG